ncbi:MAG: hypothetical protein ACOX6T_17430 [Myxococcales bacterium]|jgi:hypothetical protein
MKTALLSLALALLPAVALGAPDPEVVAARQAQLEALRGQVAGQIQLQAYDLLDELVFGWTLEPPFALETPVILADVTVPVGFGSGLGALVENHFAALITKNPKTRVVLAHCPQCTSVVVQSGAKGTIVSRGVDLPDALSKAGALSGAKHALFLDFEVEGASLVLRARITSLEPALPIVFAKTLSTSTSTPALLRAEEQLKSASEARKEYLAALEGRGLLLVPVRFGVRTYASSDDYYYSGSGVMATPMVWLQAGVEASLTQARAWTGSFSVGASWMPEMHTAWMLQARVARLLTGSVSSLTYPDLYGFIGGAVISVHGRNALAFSEEPLTIENLTQQLIQEAEIKPHAAFAAFSVGLELRVKNRISVIAFLESMPFLDAPSLGSYLDLELVNFRSFGAEVSFCF